MAKKAKWAARKYTGQLARPIFVDLRKSASRTAKFDADNVEALVPKARRNYDEAIRDKFAERFGLLFLAHGINPAETAEPWKALALQLAMSHVPGCDVVFVAQKSAGAPVKHSIVAKMDWLNAVEDARDEIAKKRNCPVKKVSTADAIKGAAKRDPKRWRGKRLEANYYEFKKELDQFSPAELMRAIDAHYEKSA